MTDTTTYTTQSPDAGPTTNSAPLTARQRVHAWLADFEAALAARDVAKAAGKFATDSFWRDLIAFTWNIKTVEGREGIADMLTEQLSGTDPSGFRLHESPTEEISGQHLITSAFIEFDTAVGRGVGHLRLRDDQGWTLLTALEELKGFEERTGPTRVLGTVHGSSSSTLSWAEQRREEELSLGVTDQPYVLVVGGGQAGIALGARLRQLQVPAIVVDRYERPGDQWRKRYKSLCLHDPVWYDHMPYIPFPPNWPVFSPKDKMGDWLEFYTKVMEIPYWGSTECLSASFDESEQRWTVELDRNGERVTLQPAHLVLASPTCPSCPDRRSFRAISIIPAGTPDRTATSASVRW